MTWTLERVQQLSTDELTNLRDNAERKNRRDIFDICETELKQRKRPRTISSASNRSGQVVVGFHFVCDEQKGVTNNPDGTAWTGTWVVDEAHAAAASKLGAYVALHLSKSEASYLQGIVKDWRKMPREKEYGGQQSKTPMGIDFLLELTTEPKNWIGEGTGEKGYNWQKIGE